MNLTLFVFFSRIQGVFFIILLFDRVGFSHGVLNMSVIWLFLRLFKSTCGNLEMYEQEFRS